MMTEEKRERILTIALDVFFKHGYRRVEMKEIASAAGISRPGLYLYFKTKEEIFSAAILQYSQTKIVEIAKHIGTKKTLEDKIFYTFEIWCIKGFDRTLESPEAKEVSDCSLEFARDAVDESYRSLEVLIAAELKAHAKTTDLSLPPVKIARLLVSAVRGFKLASRSSVELRKLIQDLIRVSF